MSNQRKNILVTGAAGFIGFHAAKALLAEGHHVVGLDNFNSYYSPELKRKRATLLQADGIEIIEADINDKSILNTILPRHCCTHVLHLAAQAGVRYAKTHPEAYLSSNINGFVSLLETLRNHTHVRLIYASSSSVYGRNTKTPFSISDTTDHPANLYAATKKANELMAYSYNHLYGIQSLGLRFFTVYGPWGRPDMAYYTFTQAILAGKPIHLFNQGKMQRDFTFIDDIVDGILATLDYTGESTLFNLGNNQPVALLDFVSTLEKLLDKPAITTLEEASPGEVDITYADITDSQSQLGFKPKTSLETGLRHFIDWYLREIAR